jgi:hypothetical protein
MITIDFNRIEGHATFCGRRVRGSESFFDMCRLLTDEGWSDGPAVFADETGMRCMTVRSLHSCARRYRPNEADVAAKKARQMAREVGRVTCE